MNRTAFVTGITGQDGSYLAELLLEKGYRVHGIIRRKAVQEAELGNVAHLENELHVDYGDVTDSSSVARIVARVRPDEVYSLAGQSHVRISFDAPGYTAQVNAMGPLNLLEALRQSHKPARFYQASTSEMFGNPADVLRAAVKLNEDAPMRPVSPYGSSKLFAHNLVRNYRESYDMHASSGILFNHESPRRGSNFVTQKIVRTAAAIKAGGMRRKLELGNLSAHRDWGHAKDYVRAMWLMLQHETPDDYVIASGTSHSVLYFVETVFGRLGMDWKKHVVVNEAFMRPNELHHLVGDATTARSVLGWAPEYSLEQLIDEMVASALERYQSRLVIGVPSD